MEVKQLNPREFEQFREFIYEQSGIKIGDRKVSLLSNRIRRRLETCDFGNFDSYYRHLTSRQGAGELEYFLDAITTNETFFFRTPAHFTWLNSTFLPELVNAYRRGEREASLRIWSAACASGAEAFAIAICLAQNRFRLRDWSMKILGTDISEQEVGKARNAVFPARTVEPLTEQQLRRFFRPANNDSWQVKPELREMIEFAQHNLMLPNSRPSFDCIFLCNVLIYFDEASKRQVLRNLINALAVGGYLVIGPSEGIYDMLDPLQKVAPLVYQKVNDSPQRGASDATRDALP